MADVGLINLSRRLYEFKKIQSQLSEGEVQIKERISQNENEVVNLMLALAEVYELVLTQVALMSSYGLKDTIEEVAKISSPMVKIYATLIKKGLKNVEDVPETLLEDVKNALNCE